MNKWKTLIRQVSGQYNDKHVVVWEGEMELIQTIGMKIRANGSTFCITDVYIELPEKTETAFVGPRQVIFVK